MWQLRPFGHWRLGLRAFSAAVLIEWVSSVVWRLRTSVKPLFDLEVGKCGPRSVTAALAPDRQVGRLGDRSR